MPIGRDERPILVCKDKNHMINWPAIKSEYDSLVARLSASGLDQKQRAELQRKCSHLSGLLALYTEIERGEKELADVDALIAQEDGEMKELFTGERQELINKLADLNRKAENLLFPPDPMDEKSVFLEIRAGAGGLEAALFAYDLFKMYSMFAVAKGWEMSIVDSHATDIGGYKEIIAHVCGRNVYKFLKFESGVHRVQRVPSTETQGRIHTSTVTVAVMPEMEEVDININPADLRIDTYRAGGAGGQHVNKTDSAVRITHIPTGIVVQCQDERSQIKNRAKAMKILMSRMHEAERERIDKERSEQRKQQVGTGDRAEKIRTYNFPQNRVTDHRVEVTLKKLDRVMEGDLEDILVPLQEWEAVERKKANALTTEK